jgi:sugar (pentulose or hexulose) kinase
MPGRIHRDFDRYLVHRHESVQFDAIHRRAVAAGLPLVPDRFGAVCQGCPADSLLLEQVENQPHSLKSAFLQGTGPQPDRPNGHWELSDFDSPEHAYHQLMHDLIQLLVMSIRLVDTPTVQTIYVDGGFARNQLFVSLLSHYLPHRQVVISEVPQATSLGAALRVGLSNNVAEWVFRKVYP